MTKAIRGEGDLSRLEERTGVRRSLCRISGGVGLLAEVSRRLRPGRSARGPQRPEMSASFRVDVGL